MHHPTPTDEAAQTRSPGRRSRPHIRGRPQPGDRFLGPSGRIWTVQTITTRGNRIVLTTPTPEGDSAAIVDHLAVARMIPLPIATSSPDDTPATRRGRCAGGTATPWATPTTPGHPPDGGWRRS